MEKEKIAKKEKKALLIKRSADIGEFTTPKVSEIKPKKSRKRDEKLARKWELDTLLMCVASNHNVEVGDEGETITIDMKAIEQSNDIANKLI